MSVVIRPYQPDDASALWRLLHQTVHRVNRQDYSPEQLNVWAPESCDLAAWRRRLSECQTFVATGNGSLVGFAMLEGNGHIDCFYCAHDYQQRGVGSELLATLEQAALSRGVAQISADVSLTAKGFFLRKGFVLGALQHLTRQGVTLHNYPMTKTLN